MLRPPAWLRHRCAWGFDPTMGQPKRAIIRYNTSPLAVMVSRGRRGLTERERRELMRPLADLYVAQFILVLPDFEIVSCEPAHFPDEDPQAKYHVLRVALSSPLDLMQEATLKCLWACTTESAGTCIEAHGGVLQAMTEVELGMMLRAAGMRLDGQVEKIVAVADELLAVAADLIALEGHDIAIRVERGALPEGVETLFAHRPNDLAVRRPIGQILMLGDTACSVYDVAHAVTQMMVDLIAEPGIDEQPIFARQFRALLRRMARSGILETAEGILTSKRCPAPSHRVRIALDDGYVLTALWCGSGAGDWGRLTPMPEATLYHLRSLPGRGIPEIPWPRPG